MKSALILALSSLAFAAPQLASRDPAQCGPDYPPCPAGTTCGFPDHTVCSPGVDCPAYCFPDSSKMKRQDDGSGAVCSNVGDAPCPSGQTCLTPDQYVCYPGNGCFGTCQIQHATKVCGSRGAGYDCPSGQECLTIEGAYCEEGLDCFGYCTPYSA